MTGSSIIQGGGKVADSSLGDITLICAAGYPTASGEDTSDVDPHMNFFYEELVIPPSLNEPSKLWSQEYVAPYLKLEFQGGVGPAGDTIPPVSQGELPIEGDPAATASQEQQPLEPSGVADASDAYFMEQEAIADCISKAQKRNPWRDYLRTAREILSVTPQVWWQRSAYTALGAICVAISTFTFSQSVALIGESAGQIPINEIPEVVSGVLKYFAASIGFWLAYYFLQYKGDMLTQRQEVEVDFAIDCSIKGLTGKLPEKIRQRQDVSRLLSLVERHQDSSKDLVSGIIGLSQECVEMLVTTAIVVWNGSGLGILPIVLGGYLRYCTACRVSERQVRSEDAAAGTELLYADGSDTLSTNRTISMLQIAHTFKRFLGRVMTWKSAADNIRLDALKKNEWDELITNLKLEVPVAGACLCFISQWISGEMSPAWCIWLLMSAWSLRSNINEIGTLVSAQVTDLNLASHRHALGDVAQSLGDQREEVTLTAAPAINFNQVTLRRPGSTGNILKNITMNIPPGTCTVILGHNGAGKSSLLGLILGSVTPTQGEVTVGNYNTRYNSIFSAPLSQNPLVLPGITVRDNIELFQATNEGMRAEEVVRILQIRDALFNNKQNGLDTVVPGRNQDGPVFSGGQLQLIALARAIAAGSRLLVLDEPFSQLSPEMRVQMHEKLLTMCPQVTLVIVTHDVNQVRGCDLAVIIERGQIVEQGSPYSLLNDPASKLSELQQLQAGSLRRARKSRKKS